MPAAARLVRVLSRPAVAAVAVALIAYAIGTVLRYRIIEPEVIGEFCRVDGPAWCDARRGLIVLTEVGAVGGAGLALVLGSFLARGRAGLTVLLAGMVLGGAGLVLYNANPGAFAVVLGLLRAVRLDRG